MSLAELDAGSDDDSIIGEYVGGRSGKMIRKVAAVLAYYAAGCIYYGFISDLAWGPDTVFYFLSISVPTIGYGDVTPVTDGDKLFTVFYIMFGIAVIYVSITNSIVELFERIERKASPLSCGLPAPKLAGQRTKMPSTCSALQVAEKNRFSEEQLPPDDRDVKYEEMRKVGKEQIGVEKWLSAGSRGWRGGGVADSFPMSRPLLPALWRLPGCGDSRRL